MRPWLITLAALAVSGAILLAGRQAWHPGLLSGEASLVIDFGNGEQRAFRGEVIPDMNARMALLAAAEGAGFEVTFDAASGEVRAIAGQAGRWEVMKTGNGSSRFPADLPVAAGDQLTLRRISP